MRSDYFTRLFAGDDMQVMQLFPDASLAGDNSLQLAAISPRMAVPLQTSLRAYALRRMGRSRNAGKCPKSAASSRGRWGGLGVRRGRMLPMAATFSSRPGEEVALRPRGRGDERPLWRRRSEGASSCSTAGLPDQGMDWPMSFSIEATALWSPGATMVTAAPLRPARPVRPMRWT